MKKVIVGAVLAMTMMVGLFVLVKQFPDGAADARHECMMARATCQNALSAWESLAEGWEGPGECMPVMRKTGP